MTIQSFVTDGWPVLMAYHAALAARKGALAIISGSEEDLEAAKMALNWCPTVTVDSYRDECFREHLMVEAIQ
jgi:hypothetical protein